MRLLLFILPTILLTSYSQLITKWRVSSLMAQQVGAPGLFARLVAYLSDPYILSAYVFSLLSSFAWLYVVEKYPVSIAFPAYTGVLFAVVVLGGNLLLREPISPQHLAGVLLIMLGVVLVSRSAG